MLSAYRYAQLLLKYRPRSEFEIRTRLLRRHYDKSEIEDVISKLKKLDLLDDASFAKFWIQYRLSSNPRSKFLLKIELKKKGVSEKLIENAFELRTDLDERALAYSLAQKKYRILKRESDLIKKKRRLYSYLQRRGFKYSLSKEVIENLIGES